MADDVQVLASLVMRYFCQQNGKYSVKPEANNFPCEIPLWAPDALNQTKRRITVLTHQIDPVYQEKKI